MHGFQSLPPSIYRWGEAARAGPVSIHERSARDGADGAIGESVSTHSRCHDHNPSLLEGLGEGAAEPPG